MIHHHPGDELLLPLAAGRLAVGPALVVNAHLEACAECRDRVRTLQAIGGALVEDAEPVALAPEAWGRTLARIDAGGAPPARRRRSPPAPLPLPAGMAWPAALSGCTTRGWRWMGPGMRYARLASPQDPDAKLYLLRISAGRSLAQHSHRGMELSQVLVGAFADGRATFAAGDFDVTDDDVMHQPVVAQDAECVCLAYIEGSLSFAGPLASAVGRMIGV
ncbi:MAG: cupin domain-containing protein [Proteobacteria bacterium]|nr:cupin domain-containing protein [Pseudomonadota bacterium]